MKRPGPLLSLPGLRLTAVPHPKYAKEPYFASSIAVKSYPFAGKLTATFTSEDLLSFAVALERLSPVGTAVLGGGRATELRLVVEKQQGGTPGDLAIEGSLCASGDDPWPRLEFLMFDVSPSFAQIAATRLRAAAVSHPAARARARTPRRASRRSRS